MSDEENKKPPEGAEEATAELDSAKLKALLKKSLASAGPIEDEPIPDDAPESGAMKALLKRSLAADEPADAPSAKPGEPSEADRELLLKVQKKLRQRSKGKFYGDGWSTTQSKLNYVLIAGVMLVTIIAVYLALGPSGISVR